MWSELVMHEPWILIPGWVNKIDIRNLTRELEWRAASKAKSLTKVYTVKEEIRKYQTTTHHYRQISRKLFLLPGLSQGKASPWRKLTPHSCTLYRFGLWIYATQYFCECFQANMSKKSCLLPPISW